MSSKEIAELTGKEHFNVKRDIRAMLEELGKDALSFEGMSADAYGRPLPVFNLPKNLTLTLITGYSTVLRNRIIDRWQELEAQAATPALPNFSNPAEAARAWAMHSLSPATSTATPSPSARTAERRRRGWFNMTKAAQHFGKQLQHFWLLKETQEYVAELAQVTHRNPDELTDARPGRYGGTWAHPKLAVFFARWLDVKFSVWCDAVIEDILTGKAEVTIVKPKESAVMALPNRPPSH